MGGWGFSRARRVECGAVLLPVSSVAVSSAAVVRHAWAARCRLSGGLATSSLSLRLLHASYNRTHRLLRSQPHVRVGCRRWPRHQPSRPCLQRFAHSSHMAAALSAAVALRAPHFAPRHPSPSLSSAGCLRFAFALQFRQWTRCPHRGHSTVRPCASLHASLRCGECERR